MLLVLESDASVMVAVTTVDMVLLLCISCNQQQQLLLLLLLLLLRLSIKLASIQVVDNLVVSRIVIVIVNQSKGSDHGDVDPFAATCKEADRNIHRRPTYRQSAVVRSCS
jgi:hypothetical protein